MVIGLVLVLQSMQTGILSPLNHHILTAWQVDEIFTSVVTSEATLVRKVDSKSGVSTFDLLDFFIAIMHVAAHRYAAMSQEQVGCSRGGGGTAWKLFFLNARYRYVIADISGGASIAKGYASS